MSKEVERALQHARPSITGWWRVDCPLCLTRTGKADRKQALAINVKSGAFYCWKCHLSGRIRRQSIPVDAEETQDAREAVQAMEPPEGFTMLAGDDSFSLELAREYAAKRCPPEMWEEVQIGACVIGKYAGRVIIPVLAEDGMTWLGWVGRTWYKSDRAYSYPRGMNRGELLYRGQALWEDTEEPLLVVEGVFDALHLWPNAVAVLGKASELQMESLAASKRPIVVVLDGDAWLEAYAMSLRLKIYGKTAGYVRLPPKLDPDEVPRDWLAEEVRRAL